MPLDLGVLVSGDGSNLQAILDAAGAGRLDARVRVVVSNRPDAFALERARRAAVPAVALTPRPGWTREQYDLALVESLRAHGVDFVALAGFMRVLTPAFLAAFPGRIVNIHPALLPAYPGLHGIRQALDAGAKITGCTVHFVDEGVDTGPIIAQAALAVRDSDDEASLHARVKALEHRLYPAVLGAIAAGRVRLEGRRVVVDHAVPSGDWLASMEIG